MAHDATLGKLITEPQNRDAIHVAIAPVIATEKLKPGQHVGFTGNDVVHVGSSNDPIGIVDPFLKEDVQLNQEFWVCLYPQTITSLRHDWVHPAFKSQQDAIDSVKQASEQWLRDYADEMGLSYNALLDAAAGYLSSGRRVTLGYDTPDIVGLNRKEFWEHYGVVTDQEIDSEDTFFSCSC